jgi:hypothetical protein
VIGIKPPRLLEVSDKSIGVLMFIEEKDVKIKLSHPGIRSLILLPNNLHS